VKVVDDVVLSEDENLDDDDKELNGPLVPFRVPSDVAGPGNNDSVADAGDDEDEP
jgi:hypothetical protein